MSPKVAERPNEVRAASDLAAEIFGGTVSSIERTHLAVAARSFGLSGAGRSPARLLHDGISKVAYGSVRGAGRLGGAMMGVAAGAIGELDATHGGRPISETRTGAVALGAINGWAGDRLAERDSDLAVGMSLRDPRGHRIHADAPSLAAAYPGATKRLAVFIHGLTETERTWWFGMRSGDGTGGRPYGDRLAADLGYTPLYLRYNSGLRVSENGRELATLLDRVVAEWPVGVEEIAVFGFSMGGLVARSANHVALGEGMPWVERVRHVFHLGVPHHGAPLERLTNATTARLRRLPEVAAVADVLDGRSGGIKDMRYGNVLDADWRGYDPDEVLRDRRRPVPYLESAAHYFLAATLTRSPGDPISRVLGDMLVLLPSAWAEGTHGHRGRFEIERSRHYGGLTHFHLANHDAVYAQIRSWLTRRELEAGPAPA